jgi:two-component system sensor histidine kinase ArlS
MKNKIREILKLLLAKVIVPIHKKREEWLGNFRFSIAFRISLHYLKLLIISGVLFMIGFVFLFYTAEYKSMNDRVLNAIKSIEKDDITGELDINNPFYIDDIAFRLTDENNQIIYNDITKDISEEKNFLKHIYYHKELSIFYPTIIIYDDKDITLGDKTYHLYIQYDMSYSTEKAVWLLGTVGLLYLIFVYFIIRRGKVSDLKLLEPIHDMSATANRLTVNNLNSQRLNVEGTKNELKDLAGVINNMLDRIEISYESQKQFVSDASHELRTPISVIQGYANLLNRWGTKDEEVLLESVEAIINEAKAMQDLVEKLLFLSRHDKKKLKLDKRKFNMSNVIEDMVKETKLVTTNRIIISDVVEDVVVYGDKQALKQAIRVLIDNAVKYTKDGDSITINCENEDDDCIITVRDTGIGMTKKDIENIFERFYRSDNVRNEKISGHGLGLSIAKLIILGHTGMIRVRSQFTKGTIFTITLPRRF